jgi:2Fe-2S ferredoxin
MPTIKFIKEKKTIEVPAGANLRQEALKHGVEIYPGIHKYPLLNCMGFSMCGKCAVLVKKGMENCNVMGVRESLRLKPSFIYIGHENEMRLACQTKVNGDIEVETQPEMNWYGDRFWG